MISNWEKVTLISTIIGLLIMLFSILKMLKISKKLKQIDEKEVVPGHIVTSLFKYQKVLILGMLIAILSVIIARFM